MSERGYLGRWQSTGVAAHRRIFVEDVPEVHLPALSPSSQSVSVAVMKMQLAALAGIAVYVICTTTCAGMLTGVLPLR